MPTACMAILNMQVGVKFYIPALVHVGNTMYSFFIYFEFPIPKLNNKQTIGYLGNIGIHP